MVNQIATQGSLFDLQTVIDYGQSVVNVGQELVKSGEAKASAILTKPKLIASAKIVLSKITLSEAISPVCR